MKRVYGIIGWPVWHTRSPSMHNAAFRAVDIDAVYAPFGVRPPDLQNAVVGLRALGVRGVNVTLPHKQNVMAHLDEVEEEAAAIGAVNTILVEKGRLIGCNTDAEGLVRSLRDHGFDPTDASSIVVGAGGAARAAVAGLAAAGARRIVVAARRQGQAERLQQELAAVTSGTDVVTSELAQLPRSEFSEASLLVQATSATLDDGPEASRFAETLPLDAMPKTATVTDLVYAPRRTTVIRAAERLGLSTVDGLGMLLHQGAIAFERWTGVDAPLEVMRKALE